MSNDPLVAFFDLVCGLRGYVAVRTAAPLLTAP
jgi:hypothetical protein